MAISDYVAFNFCTIKQYLVVHLGLFFVCMCVCCKRMARIRNMNFIFLLRICCNSGDLGSIPGSGRSAGEGIGNPLQYSWASLVAQLVRNPPAMWETWVQSQG